MKFKYSICHPDNHVIEYPNEILSVEQVKEIVLNYPWKSQLQKMKTMNLDKIHYNPSLDFKNQKDNYSFCLTAEGEPEDYSFSVWYNRPVMKKVLFGLMGENEKFLVIDKWFTREDSFKLLNKFLEKDYKAVESEMKKPQPCT